MTDYKMMTQAVTAGQNEVALDLPEVLADRYLVFVFDSETAAPLCRAAEVK